MVGKKVVLNPVDEERKRILKAIDKLYYGDRRFMVDYYDLVEIVKGKNYEDLKDDKDKRNISDDEAREELMEHLQKKSDEGNKEAVMVQISDELDIPTSQVYRVLKDTGVLGNNR